MEREAILWVIGGLVVAGAIIAIVLAVVLPRRRSLKLREEFGPEYEHTVGRYGDRSRAEADLVQRKERVSGLRLRSLSEDERARFLTQWKQVQSRFVDEPSTSILEANMMVAEVMRARGYPLRDFETQAADLSVNYPALTENYRSAHAIFVRNEQGHATTEELRQALVFYRGVFSELLDDASIRPAA